MTVKPVNTMLLSLIVAVTMAGCWMIGKRQGENEAAIAASQGLASEEAQLMIFSLQQELRARHVELLSATQSSSVAAARTRTLQSELDELLQESLSDASDLALFRRIETGEEPRGVVIEALSWRQSQPQRLKLTLVQWRGRNRIKGEVRVTLNYKEPEQDTAEQYAAASSSATTKRAIKLEPRPFDFRFFQKFDVLMGIRTDENRNVTQFPESVDIRVVSKDKRLKEFQTRISWEDIAE